jgi:hypothetical protein
MVDDPTPDVPVSVESLTSFVVAAGAAAVGSLDPTLAIVASGAGAGAMPLLQKAIQAAYDRFTKKFTRTVEAGVQDSGVSFQELIIAADKDPFRQQLTSDVLEASGKTPFEDKLVALGRAWAKGILTDDDAVLAREQQFVRSLARLEYPHLRVLNVIRGDFTQVPQGLALVDGWTTEAVRSQLPEYGDLVPQLISVLVSEGLIANQTIQNPLVPGTQFRITQAGEELFARVEDASTPDA